MGYNQSYVCILRNSQKNYVLYVQEVVTLQKKIFNIFASENEVYTINYYDTVG